MLVTFRSKAAGSITMFGDHATQLLQLMGASGRVPGAMIAPDVPEALRKLQEGLAALETPARAALNEDSAVDEEDEKKQPPVALAVRAAPLLDLLQRATTVRADVVWEKSG